MWLSHWRRRVFLKNEAIWNRLPNGYIVRLLQRGIKVGLIELEC